MLQHKKRMVFAAIGGVFAMVLILTSFVIRASIAEEGSTRVTFMVKPYISITATDVLELEITPTADGKFTYGNIAVRVNTNDASGYSLYLSSDSVATTLENIVARVSIPTLSTAATAEDMPNNTWGWSLGESYNPVPANTDAVKIKTTSTPAVSQDLTNVSIGAKADLTIPSGTYTNTILFTTVANSSSSSSDPDLGPDSDIFDLEEMQDMSTTYCANTTTPLASATLIDTDGSHDGDQNYVPEKTLTDSRDGKTYVIRKLADGNCWMVQNLAIEGPRTLTSDDTDLVENTTFDLPGLVVVNGEPRWWDYNTDDAYIAKPTDGDYVINGTTVSDTGLDVEKRGNWYTWGAATAGTSVDAKANGVMAASSICPKGWKLPDYTGSKSWDNLISTTYNIPTGTVSTGAGTTIMSAPFNLLSNGYYTYGSSINPNNNRIYDVSEGGWYWSSTASSNTSAHYLMFNPNWVDPNAGSSRGDAWGVRCVSR